MGRIAREVAWRAQALGMKVISTDVLGRIEGLPYEFTSLDGVLQEADYVSLHIPATPDKMPLLDSAMIARMKDGAVLVNLARGTLIDTAALCDALDEGKLSGAALDVYPEEPVQDERLVNHPRISLTPHIGAATKEAQQRIGAEIVDIISGFFA